jgi:hypothetical protein
MKMAMLIAMTISSVLLCSGWLIGEDPQSPSTAYLEFRQLVIKGDAEQSWDYISKDTQKAILELDDTMVSLTEGAIGTATDPLTDRLACGLAAEMHLSLSIESSDFTAWRSVISEAGETHSESYFQPGFCITGEIVELDKATLTIESGTFKRTEKMVKEEGKWKVVFPYVVSLAQAGWQLDLANYLSKLHDIMAMNRDSGLNARKSDVSVREVVRK